MSETISSEFFSRRIDSVQNNVRDLRMRAVQFGRLPHGALEASIDRAVLPIESIAQDQGITDA